jgi:hypothetical protein
VEAAVTEIRIAAADPPRSISTGHAPGRLFGDERSPPLWLWLSLEATEVAALEAALIAHLRSSAMSSG